MAYFVKATLKDTDAARQSAKDLGIDPGPHRFAIVDAWEASTCQKGISRKDAASKWGKACAKALTAARVFKRASDVASLFEAVQKQAEVFSITEDSHVRLQHPGGAGTPLLRLAVPLSSRYHELYHRPPPADDNWAVHPMVMINKDKNTVTMPAKVAPAKQSAINAINERLLYFVHTYSMSNRKFL